MNEDILFTPEEIAQKLKITKGTVYEMIKRGELEAHRIGRHLRISRTQFDIYLSKSRGYDNTYEATIIRTNDETYAKYWNSPDFMLILHLKGRLRLLSGRRI
ncbi:MAG: helix-turn-helix domain-containing protein [Desulfitobacteriia bacterium]